MTTPDSHGPENSSRESLVAIGSENVCPNCGLKCCRVGQCCYGIGCTQSVEQWRQYLDWAQENDEDGGHVELSRYYRERAWQIERAT